MYIENSPWLYYLDKFGCEWESKQKIEDGILSKSHWVIVHTVQKMTSKFWLPPLFHLQILKKCAIDFFEPEDDAIKIKSMSSSQDIKGVVFGCTLPKLLLPLPLPSPLQVLYCFTLTNLYPCAFIYHKIWSFKSVNKNLKEFWESYTEIMVANTWVW